MSEFSIVHGDCLEAMADMDEGSVDAVVTDPPYGIRFMGKRWDYDVPGVDVFEAMRRVLKEGGRLLCFAGSRTAHRMTVNIEDAGFVIEDVVMWLYGSGFPKHASKLKPAYEPVVVARKGGVSEINIDAGRIPFASEGDKAAAAAAQRSGRDQNENRNTYGGFPNADKAKASIEPYIEQLDNGRWPANVALDEEAAALLDEQSGDLHGSGNKRPSPKKPGSGSVAWGTGGEDRLDYVVDEAGGGASRFYYCAKATRAERERGLEGAKRTPSPHMATSDGHRMGAHRGEGAHSREIPSVANHHPTVKPVALMRWLVRLVADPGDTVLDPYMGSGTTGVACTLEGVRFVGVEMDEEYLEIARLRIANTQPSLFAQ